MICFCTTEHLEDGLWFRDEEDFKVGMNHVAIESSYPHFGPFLRVTGRFLSSYPHPENTALVK